MSSALPEGKDQPDRAAKYRGDIRVAQEHSTPAYSPARIAERDAHGGPAQQAQHDLHSK
jgi:hypothetical protein